MKSRLLIVLLGVALGLAAKAVFGPPNHSNSAKTKSPVRQQTPGKLQDSAPPKLERPQPNAEDEDDRSRLT